VEKLKERLGDKIEFIAVNVWINENMKKIQKYIKEKQLKVTHVIDREAVMMSSFGVLATPTQIVIDRKGMVRYIDPQVPDDIEEHMEELLR
jgi:peroxiredoxin